MSEQRLANTERGGEDQFSSWLRQCVYDAGEQFEASMNSVILDLSFGVPGAKETIEVTRIPHARYPSNINRVETQA